MTRLTDSSAELPGYCIPVHRELTAPLLLGGPPRSIALLTGPLAAARGLRLRLWLAGWPLGASAPLAGSNTRTAGPNATARSVRSGFTAIKGLGACRMCSPPQFSPGPPFPPPAPSVPGSAPLCLRLFRRGIARSRTTPHAPFWRRGSEAPDEL